MIKKKNLFILALVSALLLIQMGVALADDNIPSSLPAPVLTTQTVPMTLNCDDLVGPAQEYAEEHNLCPSGESVTPEDTRYGDCGSSTLWISNLGSGNARFHMSATSTQGAMTIVAYNTNWINWSTGGSGNVFGTDYPLSSSWSRIRDAHTGSGFVTATMSGQVTLWWGGTCSFLFPSDDEYIS
jgi:hypothetical protein